jgi:hypothetical protein
LKVTLAREDRAREAWSALGPILQIDELEVGSYGLLALLYRRLDGFGISPSMLPRLRGIYRKAWFGNRLALDLLRNALQVLGGASIPTMIANDAPAALLLYRDTGARPINELEIVIPPGTATTGVRALEEVGWRRRQPATPPELALGSTDGLRVEPADRQGEVVLRSHPLIGAGVTGVGGRDDDLWDASVEVMVEHALTRAPSAADALLDTCVNGLGGGWWGSIQWVADADLTLRRDDAVDWPRLLRRAEARGLLPPLRDALTYLGCLLESPIPAVWQRQMRQARAPRRDVVAYRISRSGGGLFGSLPNLAAQHVRHTRTQSALRVVCGLGPFLTKAWGLDRWWQIPRFAQRVLGQRLRLAAAAAGAAVRRT